MAQVHGGRLVAKALARHGVKHVFTLCGGHIQAIYDGCIDEGIRVVDTRHEQTAGHAADAYARVSGIPGVALVTAGPGVTDVVTAVANAQRAGVPLVCVGGAGPLALSHMGSLQDMDSVELMRPITKWCVQVSETRRIVELVDAGFRIAQAGLPGPVYLEIPLDVLMNFADDSLPSAEPLAPARPAPDPHALEQVSALLASAKRPCFLLGAELRWSPRREQIADFTRTLGVPAFVSGMARGALPVDHPCLFAKSRRAALAQADFVGVFGTPFDFRLDYGRSINSEARVVQADLDPAELGRNRSVDVALHADGGIVLAELAAARTVESSFDDWHETLREEEARRTEKSRPELESESSPPNPLRVCAEIAKRLGPEDIVIGDGGDFVATAANVIPIAWPRLWMDPGPLGTLGIGPGYAMAAKLLRPSARVVVVFGDGAFGLHALEFEALVRQDIPVVAVIGNDAAWTQIRRGQVALYGEDRAVATGLAHTRYEKVVEALGGEGYWVERFEELGPALDAAFQSQRPACVNVKIAQSDFRKNAISV